MIVIRACDLLPTLAAPLRIHIRAEEIEAQMPVRVTQATHYLFLSIREGSVI